MPTGTALDAGLETAFLVALGVALLAVAVTDARERRIPDVWNLAIALLGLARLIALHPAQFVDRLLDAAAIGSLLLLLRWVYRRMRGRVGLGLGDVKFVAAAALWTGLSDMTLVILLASLAALVWLGGLRLVGGSVGRGTRLAFGPFLAGALFAVLVFDAASPAAGDEAWPIEDPADFGLSVP
ncbi:prepilin peptidase [Aureimonas pseudogalii]|uniref:Leader peptidase (Prepilin peptidase)/N-methyltransferase n=1 Tax=Aureimonas pseudogalii TaxID=1744844 RepID=A0A7W6H2V2_9HYPH|nr:A24 family peptidase [Aureimonas pseudogalii]MBB3997055.1 leader peptidase (prepilin peptidase)/N-methyltransferase [Aureimonas pseudogalii]